MTTQEPTDPRSWWRATDGAPLTSALPHLGVIAAVGPDAATFLHGQLSQDIKGLQPHEARLAAYCSAKGRMLASFLVLHPLPETYWLVVRRDVLPDVLKRLTMFVLRAKCKLSGATAPAGLVGELQLGAGAAAAAPDAPAQVSVLTHGDAGQPVRWACSLPAVQGVARTLVLGAQAPDAPAPATDEQALAAWQWLEVLSGQPQIERPTVEKFVPQMVNYELIGGVNFKKGCYPGQEVVARSQYRGTTKRRAFVLWSAQAAEPGAELFSSADPGQPAGLVINAASVPAAPSASAGGVGHAVLAELKLDAHDAAASGAATLHLGQADGPALTLAPQPYAVPRDEAA